MAQALPRLQAAVLAQLCYPPGQVIGRLDGRLLVVDAEVHHVDVTVAGAGGRRRQQALLSRLLLGVKLMLPAQGRGVHWRRGRRNHRGRDAGRV